MECRNFTKQIEVWATTAVDDGYGGFTVTDALVTKMWANVKSKSQSNYSEVGQVKNYNSLQFTVRNRVNFMLDVKTNYVKYQGVAYEIDSISDLNLNNIDIVFYGSKRD